MLKKLFGIAVSIVVLALAIFLILKLVDPAPPPVTTAECVVEACAF